jgi:tryptophan 2,3-dioxygenase
MSKAIDLSIFDGMSDEELGAIIAKRSEKTMKELFAWIDKAPGMITTSQKTTIVDMARSKKAAVITSIDSLKTHLQAFIDQVNPESFTLVLDTLGAESGLPSTFEYVKDQTVRKPSTRQDIADRLDSASIKGKQAEDTILRIAAKAKAIQAERKRIETLRLTGTSDQVNAATATE